MVTFLLCFTSLGAQLRKPLPEAGGEAVAMAVCTRPFPGFLARATPKPRHGRACSLVFIAPSKPGAAIASAQQRENEMANAKQGSRS